MQFRAIVQPGHGLKTAGWLNYYLLERGRRIESKVRRLGAPQGEAHRSAAMRKVRIHSRSGWCCAWAGPLGER